MKGTIGKLYHNRVLAKIFHTLVSCLQNELSDCETVLDLGCGPGSPLQYCKGVKYSVGVEAFKPYLLASQKRKIHTKYLGKKIEDLTFPPRSFDAVIMIEVLEHLPKDQGEKILEKAGRWARKKVIVSTPNGYFPMDNVDKNSWQKHRSGWGVEDFLKRGFVCHGLAGMKILYSEESQVSSMVSESEDNLYANIRFKPKKLFYFLNSLFQIVSFYFPRVSFELLAVKKIKKKVILINPPLFFSEGIPNSLDVSVPPLGLLYLASYLNKYAKGIKAAIIDAAAEKLPLEQIFKKIKQEEVLAVGISAMTPQLQGAVELAKFLKEKSNNEIKIFLGGPHVSADPDFINRFTDYFDYAITGEAEMTFLETVEALSRGEKIARLQAGEAITDLDSIPFPDRTLIHRGKYSQRQSMMFSRGCPYQCYYCSRPAIAKTVRYRSAGNMIQEIKSVYKCGHGKIDFQDDTFNLDKKSVLEFCEAVLKEGLKLDWRCNARIDLMDEELLCAMKNAGCSLVHFGIEAGDEKIRKEVVKKGQFTNKQIYGVIALCKKYGIKFGGYFMIGHPGESKKQMEQTRKMILDSGIDLLGLSIPTPFPGSELYEIAKQRNVINEGIIDQFARKELGGGYVGNYPVFVSEKVSREDVYGLMREINRMFYINFKTLFKKLKEDFLSPDKLYSDIKDLSALLLKGVSSRKPYVNKK